VSASVRRAAIPGALFVFVAALVWAPAAFAHARLVGTIPESGSTVGVQPTAVIFKYDQPVGGTEGAVRVYDSEGKEVDDGHISHPGGRQSWLGVGLEPSLPDGTYTATYRVISADTHIVSGGLVFNLGHPSAGGGVSVAGLTAEEESGEVTKIAIGIVRFLDYLSIALMVGGLIFLAFAWRPGFAEARREEPRWDAAADAFGRRAVTLLGFAVLLGVVVSLLGILLQGASAAGVSLWGSLKSSIVEDTLDSRFGTVWLLRAFDWAALGALLLLYVKAPSTRRLLALPATIGCAYLASTPAFAGHASVESPIAVMFPSDFIHVLAASVWVGGVAFLALALPVATRQLEPSERTQVLLAVLARFSPIALGAVVAIAVTGLVQAYVDVRRVADLFDTTYGLLVLAKMVLLAVLIGFGWVNRNRIIPRLRRLVEVAGAAGSVGALARRSLRGELVLMLVVFAVTAALVAYAPPIDAATGPMSPGMDAVAKPMAMPMEAATGPFSTRTDLGPAELELSVEPAEVGPNRVHLTLTDAKDGGRFTETKELTINASLPSKGIGPLKLQVKKVAPGRYVVSAAQLTPGGDWELEITDRVSAFDEFAKKIMVPIG
jgi:copper transport protein